MDLFRDKISKKLATFLILMASVSIIFNFLIIQNGGKIEENILYAVVLIFSPAVLSLLVNFIFEKNLRGFLLNNLYKKMSFAKANLITGMVWALFHYPLLLLGNYNNGATPAWFAFLFFTIALMGANTIINWIYIKSGSLWTAVIFHTVHNSLLNDINPLIENTQITPYLLTEFGAVLAIAIMIVALFFLRQQDKLPPAIKQ